MKTIHNELNDKISGTDITSENHGAQTKTRNNYAKAAAAGTAKKRKLPPGKPKNGGREERKTRKGKGTKGANPNGTRKKERGRQPAANPNHPAPETLHLQTVNLVSQIIM